MPPATNSLRAQLRCLHETTFSISGSSTFVIVL
jgi:hypothetical protein